MPKRGQFLSIVQTAVPANGVSVASRPELAQAHGDEYSTEAVLRFMAAAVEAGEQLSPAGANVARGVDHLVGNTGEKAITGRQPRPGRRLGRLTLIPLIHGP